MALVEALTSSAKAAGVVFMFSCTAQSLVTDEDGIVTGLNIKHVGGRREALACRALVLASGGFQGNAEMQTKYIGPKSINLRPVARGGS